MGRPLGQHFLKSAGVVIAMLKAAKLVPDDHVVEVGSGKGIVTKEMAKKTKTVTAVELDETLLPYLRALRALHPNIQIIHGDILKFPPPKTPYKVIGSLPYYITSPIIKHFLYEQAIQGGNVPTRMVLLIQKEVAEKICEPKGSVLGLHVRVFGTPTIARRVPRSAFAPPPKVDSAVLVIDVAKKPRVQGDLGLLFQIINAGFAYRRKTIKNAFKKEFGKEKTRTLLEQSGIDGMRRAETLSVQEWETLLRAHRQ